MIIRANRKQGPVVKINFKGETIQSEKSCKILGYIYSQDGYEIGNLHNCISKCYQNLQQMRKLPKMMDTNTRSILAKAYIVSVINYSAFSFVSLPQLYLNKLHKLLMLTARWILNSYCFKISCKNIYLQADLLDENQLIATSVYRFNHRLVNYKLPSCLYNKLTFPKRTCQDVAYKFKGNAFLKSYMNLGLRLFNKVPHVNTNSNLAFKTSLKASMSRPGAALELVRNCRAG